MIIHTIEETKVANKTKQARTEIIICKLMDIRGYLRNYQFDSKTSILNFIDIHVYKYRVVHDLLTFIQHLDLLSWTKICHNILVEHNNFQFLNNVNTVIFNYEFKILCNRRLVF